MKKFGIKEVVATGIGTALFIVLTEVQIPLVIVPNTSLQVRAALLAFLAAVFGPVVGGITGLLGHALGDALFYGSVWWSWVFPEAVIGIAIGAFANKLKIKEGGFGGKQIALFNIVQVITNAVAWIVNLCRAGRQSICIGCDRMPCKRDHHRNSRYIALCSVR